MQISDDRFAFGGGLMPLADAHAEIQRRLDPVTAVVNGDVTSAVGRVLAADIVSDRDVPPHANTAVDGYAFRFADLATTEDNELTLGGVAGAGHPWSGSVPAGTAVRVLTGAVLPQGADTVVMQEDVALRGSRFRVPDALRPGANARCAGEDIRAGTRVLSAGTRVGAAEAGILSAIGLTSVKLRSRLRVGVFSSGDELVEPGDTLGPGQIYDSNRAALCVLAQGAGTDVTDLGILQDSAEEVGAALRRAVSEFDLILISGGMSESEEDHVRRHLAETGSLHFWRLAVKPGRPVGLGQLQNTPIVGLPGNPVAAFVMFLVIARPVIARLTGEDWTFPAGLPGTSGFAYQKKVGRREFLRVRRGTADDAQTLELFPRAGAGILSSVAWAEGLAILPEELKSVDVGDALQWLPFHGLLS